MAVSAFSTGFPILAIPWEQADADAGGHKTLVAFKLKRRLRIFQILCAKLAIRSSSLQILQYADEFVAAHAGDGVFLARAVQQAGRHRP